MLAKVSLCLLVLLCCSNVYAMWRWSGSGSSSSWSTGTSSRSSSLLSDTDRRDLQAEEQYNHILNGDSNIERGRIRVHYGKVWKSGAGRRQAIRGWIDAPWLHDNEHPPIDPKGTIFTVPIRHQDLQNYDWTFTIEMALDSKGSRNQILYTRHLPFHQNSIESNVVQITEPDEIWTVWATALNQKMEGLQHYDGYQRAYEEHLLDLENSLLAAYDKPGHYSYDKDREYMWSGMTMFVIRWQDIALAARLPSPEQLQVFLNAESKPGMNNPSIIIRPQGIIQTGPLK